jgi:hypothetical protein
MKHLEFVLDNFTEVLKFLKSRFPMYHRSNFFFRDVQYGVQTMLEDRGVKVRYAEAEKIARALVEKLEREEIFQPIDRQTWAVHYPEFKTPPVKPAAKPAGTPLASAPAQAVGAAQPA